MANQKEKRQRRNKEYEHMNQPLIEELHAAKAHIINLETELEALRDEISAIREGTREATGNYGDSHRRAIKQRKQLEQLLVDSRTKAVNENNNLYEQVVTLMGKTEKQGKLNKYTVATALYFTIRSLNLDKNESPFVETAEVDKIQRAITESEQDMTSHMPFLVRYLQSYWRNVGIHWTVKTLLSLALELEVEGGAFAAISVFKELAHFGTIDMTTICHVPQEWIDKNIGKNKSHSTLKIGLEAAHTSYKHKTAYDAAAELAIGKRTLEQYRNWYEKMQMLANSAEGAIAQAFRNGELMISNSSRVKGYSKP